MSFGLPNIQLQAGGNITPNRVVCLSTTLDNTGLQSAAASSPNIGIAQGGTQYAPGTGEDTGYAASLGWNVMIWGPGTIGIGESAGSVAAGDRLTSDSNGRVITTTNAGDRCIGIAIEAGTNQGDMIEILMSCFEVG